MQVEDRLARRNWHDELMASGILGVLKAWIEPMPDGSLPNTKVPPPALSDPEDGSLHGLSAKNAPSLCYRQHLSALLLKASDGAAGRTVFLCGALHPHSVWATVQHRCLNARTCMQGHA